jgi:DNA-binding MarR family transcriptional regulator
VSRWDDLGFRASPYAITPIPPTDEGDRLLVGREVELARIETLVSSATTHVTVEGPNGVGKTSVISVATYRAIKKFDNDRRQLFVALPESFHLDNTDVSRFEADVYRRAARTLAANWQTFWDAGRTLPDPSDIRKWIDSPIIRSGGLGLTLGGIGGSRNRNEALNTGGFADLGLSATVREWLQIGFPGQDSGGLVCVLDNLELLETSHAARRLLEASRDGVLAVHGLKWILSGGRGIVRSVASSQALQGVLAEPVEIQPIRHADVGEVVARRLAAFATSAGSVPPVDAATFEHVYAVVGSNLRNALKLSEEFSLLDETRFLPQTAMERRRKLEEWLRDTSSRYRADADRISETAWGVFDGLVTRGGSISPSDFEELGFTSMQAMRTHIRSLESVGLVASTIDVADQRRKTITMTSKGWLVQYARSDFDAPMHNESPG